MKDVELYIAQFEPAVQARMNLLRRWFHEACPGVEERLHYKIPSFKVGKSQLYFAGYKHHIGFYPVYGLEVLEDELSPYRALKAKHSLHFLHTEPLPKALIFKIISLKSRH